ncbi:Twin-arginine translocation protein TatA [hydrothermal vent metagenome]|uniref:Twin-arginine translocation protein TatA n=1 Tax=hydrothermal vent metagenome TaxID=652676 RepID=A0A3B1A8Q7_9ZZZZ
MGFGGIGIPSLILILVIVILLFGTKRLRGIGSDLGSALKNFKKSVKDGTSKSDDADSEDKVEDQSAKSVIEGEATEKDKDKDKV